MSRTGSHLRIERMGDDVLGVVLEGDRRKPEPDHFRVRFPGGDVDIARTSDGEYWIHVAVNDGEGGMWPEGEPRAQIVDGRLDLRGKHASEVNVGDFNSPGLYHLAVRIGRRAP